MPPQVGLQVRSNCLGSPLRNGPERAEFSFSMAVTAGPTWGKNAIFRGEFAFCIDKNGKNHFRAVYYQKKNLFQREGLFGSRGRGSDIVNQTCHSSLSDRSKPIPECQYAPKHKTPGTPPVRATS